MAKCLTTLACLMQVALIGTVVLISLFLQVALTGANSISRGCYHHPQHGGSIYDFTEEDLQQKTNISLSDYKDNVS